ncbi:hypothetical Protein YC6258_04273 [Gynuella sunshinyii YC6258]|uniref:Uncharacterized protein n=1 Tax=Gynuella sunshinyii YC6258 TaxID=1445510 RepID=A0A0C5VNR4_9GAMM|nr:hypothetical Protein YC6258_04273 [Gynuella sunshinyii YC6258]
MAAQSLGVFGFCSLLTPQMWLIFLDGFMAQHLQWLMSIFENHKLL